MWTKLEEWLSNTDWTLVKNIWLKLLEVWDTIYHKFVGG